MIDAAVEPHVTHFTAQVIEPASPPFAPAATPSKPVPQQNPNKKKILFVTSEIADLVKTGGLGDVSAALPRAMSHRHDVRVLIPGYPQVLESDNPIHLVGELGGHAALPPCKIGRMDLADGLVIYVLICPELYQREGTPYGANNGRDWPDNHIRFARLGLAAAEIAAGEGMVHWKPDLVHAHDWPAGLAPAYMHWRGLHTPTLFTIHNLAYQGVVSRACCPELAIPEHALQQEGMEFYGKLSFLKAGLAYSSHIATVSATYAQEITTPAFGCGLDGFLSRKAQSGLLSGIPNGIDESWDSATDTHLSHPFSLNDWRAKRAIPNRCARCSACSPARGHCLQSCHDWSIRKAWT